MVKEVKSIKPEYEFYAKLEWLLISEFALILNRINPELYLKDSLDILFKREPFYPNDFFASKEFKNDINSASKAYRILNDTHWSRDDCNIMTGARRLSVLVGKAIGKGLTIPEEFLTEYKKRTIGLHDVNTTEVEVPDKNHDAISSVFDNDDKLELSLNKETESDNTSVASFDSDTPPTNSSADTTDINIKKKRAKYRSGYIQQALMEHIFPSCNITKDSICSPEFIFECWKKLKKALMKLDVNATEIPEDGPRYQLKFTAVIKNKKSLSCNYNAFRLLCSNLLGIYKTEMVEKM